MKAFPWGHNQSIDGMDLRDYFAAKTIESVSSSPYGHCLDAEALAIRAYLIADAMMKAREK
jgi:hypothetical protein